MNGRLAPEARATERELAQTEYAYRQWLAAETAEDTADNGSFAKETLAVAIQYELTETQRAYMIDYYVEQMTTVEIAEKYGVNKSSVSRGLARGRERLEKVLRYTNRRMLYASVKGELKRERIINRPRRTTETGGGK